MRLKSFKELISSDKYMPRLTKAQRNIQFKDDTIERFVSDAKEDSKTQAKEVARLYKDGKYRNWLTAKNLLTRFSSDSKKSRTWARKKVDEKYAGLGKI